MLCEMFAGLPRKIIEALDEINGIDGSEVKRDWGAPLQKAVVKRVAEEVVKIRERRARITDGDDFQISAPLSRQRRTARRTPSFKRSTLSPRVRPDVPPLPEQRSLGELWSPGATNRTAANRSTAHYRHNPAFPAPFAPHRSRRGPVQPLRRTGPGACASNRRVSLP